MCTHGKWIYNKFIKQSLFVDCGKCEACLQSKANKRTNRIRNNLKTGEVCLMVNLDYAPACVPYIKYSDLLSGILDLPVYRWSYRRRVMVNGVLELHEYFDTQLLDNYDFTLFPDAFYDIRQQKFEFLHNHPEPDCIGVIYYPDVQNFIKNLRQYLIRHHNFNDSFSFFICSEYGETFQRPHFHLLLFIPQGCEAIFYDSIRYAWRFNDEDRHRLRIEIAFNPADYVSSYVNCSSVIPSFLSQYHFRPKHSYSKGFGLANRDFLPLEVEKKVDSGNLTYDRVYLLDGVPTTLNSVLPRYVINRLFPKFKGYSRLTDSEIFDVICCPRKLGSLRKRCEYTDEEIRLISVSLNNAFKRYSCFMKDIYCSSVIGFSREEYAFRFVRTWNVYKSCLYRKFIENQDISNSLDVLESYDNIVDLYSGTIDSPNLQLFIENIEASKLKTDPNTFTRRLVSSSRLIDKYFKYQKKRKVNSIVFNSSFYESRIT